MSVNKDKSGNGKTDFDGGSGSWLNDYFDKDIVITVYYNCESFSPGPGITYYKSKDSYTLPTLVREAFLPFYEVFVMADLLLPKNITAIVFGINSVDVVSEDGEQKCIEEFRVFFLCSESFCTRDYFPKFIEDYNTMLEIIRDEVPLGSAELDFHLIDLQEYTPVKSKEGLPLEDDGNTGWRDLETVTDLRTAYIGLDIWSPSTVNDLFWYRAGRRGKKSGILDSGNSIADTDYSEGSDLSDFTPITDVNVLGIFNDEFYSDVSKRSDVAWRKGDYVEYIQGTIFNQLDNEQFLNAQLRNVFLSFFTGGEDDYNKVYPGETPSSQKLSLDKSYDVPAALIMTVCTIGRESPM